MTFFLHVYSTADYHASVLRGFSKFFGKKNLQFWSSEISTNDKGIEE